MNFLKFLFSTLYVCFTIFYSFAQVELSFDYKKFSLDNGLTVILSEDHSLPKVFGLVAVKAGGKNDPPDATGLAHYMEHMLFKGTTKLGTIDWEKEKVYMDSIILMYEQLAKEKNEKKRKQIQKVINELSIKANKYIIPNEFDKILKKIGADDVNAFTSYDMTVFYNSFPPSEIDKWLEIYSHRFINPVFRNFQAELETVYEEKNLYSDNFAFKLLEEFNKSFFKKHPYGQQPLIGTIEHLKNPSLHKMYEFYNTFYVPRNMALILVGDFNSEEIIPKIKEKFGVWKDKNLPEKKFWEEEDFKGREVVVKRLSPIRIGLMGFRAPHASHKDELKFEILSSLLSNSSLTGLLDELTLNNKLLAAQAFYNPYADYGQFVILFLPKIFGQSFNEAEKLILEKINKIKKGDFNDTLLTILKNEYYKDLHSQFESLEKKALTFAMSFIYNEDIEKIKHKIKEVMAITKDDIIEIANKYLTENYLLFLSKTGKPKKEKIKKPDFKPVISNINESSEFAKKIDSIKSLPLKENFVDFKSDVYYNKIYKTHDFYYTKNPLNDIFELKICFGIGSYVNPYLKYSALLANLVGTKDKSSQQIKKEFAYLGCNYEFYVTDDYTCIKINGLEKNLKKCLSLINLLLKDLKPEQEKIRKVIESEIANRKIEKNEPLNLSDALLKYAMLGEKSPYLNRPSLFELRKLKADTLIKILKDAFNYKAQVFYTGQLPPEEVMHLLKDLIEWNKNPKESLSPIEKDYISYNEKEILIFPYKKARQSNIRFYGLLNPYNLSDEPIIDAFNFYFGGDFSGLMMQEIREFRSLAYAASGKIYIPKKSGYKNILFGYIGTQSDKTIDAISVLDSLLYNMPIKKEKWDLIVNNLLKVAVSSKPYFRELPYYVYEAKLRGYNYDPAQGKYIAYNIMSFDEMYNFYKKNIQNKKFVICIVGDSRMFNLKDLAKYGKVKVLKKKNFIK